MSASANSSAKGDAAYIKQAGVLLAEIRVVNHDIAAKRLEQPDNAAADHAGADDAHLFGVKGVTGPVVGRFPAAFGLHYFFVGEEIALTAQHGPERVFGDGLGDHVGSAEEHDPAFMAGGGQAGLDRTGGMADDLQVIGCGYMLLSDLGGSPGGDDRRRRPGAFQAVRRLCSCDPTHSRIQNTVPKFSSMEIASGERISWDKPTGGR